MNRAIRALAIVAASGGIWACQQTTPAPPSPQPAAKPDAAPASEYAVTLMFDGGYVFLHDEASKSLTVAAFEAGGDGPKIPERTCAIALLSKSAFAMLICSDCLEVVDRSQRQHEHSNAK